MKILVIHNQYLEKGGEDRVVDSEIKMLRDSGNEVVFYLCSNKDIKGFSFFNKIKFLFKDISWNTRSYEEIKKLVNKEKPDVAHIHNIFVLLGPTAYFALKEASIPIVHTLHNYRLICLKGTFYAKNRICEDCSSEKFFKAVLKRCWRGSFLLTFFLARMLSKNTKNRAFRDVPDAFITLSKFSRNKFREAGFSEDKLFVKPNFVDFKFNEEKKENYGLFLGRLVDYKGVDTLLKAYAKLDKHYLKIIGDGPMFTEVERRIKNLKNVELLGALPHEEAINYLKKAAFIVFPSECYENMPLAIIESLACGTPVVATNLGVMKELIEDNVTGLLFKSQNPDDLIKKIKFLTDNSELCGKMKINARKSYEARFTRQINYDILMNIYNKAISNNKR